MASVRHQSETVVKHWASPQGSGNWFFCKSQRLGCEAGVEWDGMGYCEKTERRRAGRRERDNVFKWLRSSSLLFLKSEIMVVFIRQVQQLVSQKQDIKLSIQFNTVHCRSSQVQDLWPGLKRWKQGPEDPGTRLKRTLPISCTFYLTSKGSFSPAVIMTPHDLWYTLQELLPPEQHHIRSFIHFAVETTNQQQAHRLPRYHSITWKWSFWEFSLQSILQPWRP